MSPSERLGSGSFGVVHVEQAEVAVKQMRPSKSARDSIPHTSVREVAALAALGGVRNVPRPISMEAMQSGAVYVRMQRLGTTLLEDQQRRSTRYSTSEIRKVLIDVASALCCAHRRGIAHRDIKLENVMFDSARRSCFLIDWGLCCFVHVSRQERELDVGTPIYRSPELARGACNVRGAFAGDMWALGIMCVELFAGAHPFRAKTNPVLLEQISAAWIDDSPSYAGARYSVRTMLDDMSRKDAALAQCVRHMLALAPEERAGATDVLRAMRATPPPSVGIEACWAPCVPSGFSPTDAVRRAHVWICELCINWGLPPEVNHAAQMCFACAVARKASRSSLSDRHVAAIAATCIVLCGKALCSNPKLTSSAQRACDEARLRSRASDRSVSPLFKRLEAEVLCAVSGRLFFLSVPAKASRDADRDSSSLASFFASVCVERCCMLYSHTHSDIAKLSVLTARAIRRRDPDSCSDDMLLVIANAFSELKSSGSILRLTRISISSSDRNSIQFISDWRAPTVIDVCLSVPSDSDSIDSSHSSSNSSHSSNSSDSSH